jgi:hypothetical protein
MSSIGSVLALLLLLAGCGGGGGTDTNPPAVSLQTIEISATSLSLPKGTATTLTALGHFSNGASADISTAVNWASTDIQVATVDAQGTVLSVGMGMADISATATTAGSTTVSAEVTVTVTAPALAAIDITPPNASLAAGGSAVFRATGLYSDGSRADICDQVTWAVTDTLVATLDNGAADPGKVTAQGTGQTSVSATLNSVSANAVLVVTDATLESISVSPAQLNLAQGTEQTLVAVGQYSDQTQADISHLVQWSSTDANIASVDANGRVLAVAANPAGVQIQASLDGNVGSANITVSGAVLMDIVIEPSLPVLAVGSELVLKATGHFSDNTTQDISEDVGWAVTHPEVAEVEEGALLKALAEGQTTVTATLGMQSGSTSLRVKANDLAAIHVTPAAPSLAAGTSLSLSATGNYQDGSTQDLSRQVVWQSTDTLVASVDAEGRVTARAAGVARIVAQIGTVVGSVEIAVSEATLESLEIAPSSLTLAMGTSQQVKVVGHYSDGSTQDLTDQARWQSDNTTAASVENTAERAGLVTALNPASTTISATVGTVTGQVAVTVTSATLTSLAISPASPSLVLGTTLALTAQGTFSDSSTQDVTAEVAWDSSDYGVATVSNGIGYSGLVTGLAAGSVDIAVHLQGVTASVTLTVEDNPQVPRSLSAVATPNVILNDGTDGTTLAIAVQAADTSAVVADGTEVDLVVLQGDAVLAQNTVTTSNGVAEVGVTSTTKGVIVVQATVRGTDVSSTVPLYVTDNFRNMISRVGVVNASVEAGMLKAGSRLGLFIFNVSNRPLTIEAFYLFYAGSPVLEVTAAAPLNNGQLAGGGQTGFVVEMSADLPLDDFALVYILNEPVTGAVFDVGALFRLVM